MTMTAEQMHQVTVFAVALNRMAQAATDGTGVELSAEETAAMVAVVGSLSAPRVSVAGHGGMHSPNREGR